MNLEHDFVSPTYRVIWSNEDSEFVGLCDELPSLSHLAKTEADALEGITKLVESILKEKE
jgi:predicted RNase H-like HicB family nuclease